MNTKNSIEVLGSSKKNVQLLLQQCYKYGIRRVIISPGSRNAPLIISFTQNELFTCYSITDERSAGFFALGMARELSEPLALVCTSGTALLNYAPALCEAYYQEVPLIVLTADRPTEWIDHEDGQTIRQENIFQNYIKFSTHLPKENKDEKQVKEIVEMALSKALTTPFSPVHINLPFAEPLYKTEKYTFRKEKKNKICDKKQNDFSYLNKTWSNAEKIIIVVGIMPPNSQLTKTIKQIVEKKNIVVVAAATSNIQHSQIIDNPELFFSNLDAEQKKELQADLLLTFGGAVVSKALKLFLRKNKPKIHIDIDINPRLVDTYRSLTHKIDAPADEVLKHINLNLLPKKADYQTQFSALQNIVNNSVFKQKTQFDNFYDWNVFEQFFNFIKQSKKRINLHLANSTPIRYAELFRSNPRISYYANRGTSGIDGCTSTACGAALVAKQTTVLITGDVSFFYDSNAFWNKHLSRKLKIILINNGGGNVFRILEGSGNSKSLPFFETPHTRNAKKLCENFGVNYLKSNNLKTFKEQLKKLFLTKKCTVLEVFTDREKSAEIYREKLNCRIYNYLTKEQVESCKD